MCVTSGIPNDTWCKLVAFLLKRVSESPAPVPDNRMCIKAFEYYIYTALICVLEISFKIT